MRTGSYKFKPFRVVSGNLGNHGPDRGIGVVRPVCFLCTTGQTMDGAKVSVFVARVKSQ